MLQCLGQVVDDVCMVEFHNHVFGIFDRLYQSIMGEAGSSNIDAFTKHSQMAFVLHTINVLLKFSAPISTAFYKERGLTYAKSITRCLRMPNLIQFVLDTANRSSSFDFQQVLSIGERLSVPLLLCFKTIEEEFINFRYPQMSRIYRELSKEVQIKDETELVMVIFHTIMYNISWCHQSFAVTDATLDLLLEGVLGQVTSHACITALEERYDDLFGPDTFPVLQHQQTNNIMHSRSKFYQAIGHAMCKRLETTDNELEFNRNLHLILDKSFDRLRSWLDKGKTDNEVCSTAIGVSRDLYGLISVMTTRLPFSIICRYLINENRIALLIDILDHNYSKRNVSAPILKIFEELTASKGTRVVAGKDSALKITIFRSTSRAVCLYGKNVRTMFANYKRQTDHAISGDDLYSIKLKGVIRCLRIISNMLKSDMIDMGVLRAYGDPLADLMFDSVFLLILSIDPLIIMDYSKLNDAYFDLMKSISAFNIEILTGLSLEPFVYLLTTLKLGITSLNSNIVTMSSNVISAILNAAFELYSDKRIDRTNFENLMTNLAENRKVFNDLLQTMLNIIIFEHSFMMACIHDAFLLLILLDPDVFQCECTKFVEDLKFDGDVSQLKKTFATFYDAVKNLNYKGRDGEFYAALAELIRDVGNLIHLSSVKEHEGGNIELSPINGVI
ncbi:hypothetical protein ACOME3_001610 [Neoechinorhynchus agilis]